MEVEGEMEMEMESAADHRIAEAVRAWWRARTEWERRCMEPGGARPGDAAMLNAVEAGYRGILEVMTEVCRVVPAVRTSDGLPSEVRDAASRARAARLRVRAEGGTEAEQREAFEQALRG